MLFGYSFQMEYCLEDGQGVIMVFPAVRIGTLVMDHFRINFSSLRAGYHSASNFAQIRERGSSRIRRPGPDTACDRQ